MTRMRIMNNQLGTFLHSTVNSRSGRAVTAASTVGVSRSVTPS